MIMPYIAWLTRAFRVHYAHKQSARISRMTSRGNRHKMPTCWPPHAAA